MSKNIQESSPMAVYIILLAVIFIDSVGLVMIFPIFAPMFMYDDGQLFVYGASSELHYILYGITLASYPAAMFFGAASLGEAVASE